MSEAAKQATSVLVKGVLAADERLLARAISRVEAGGAEGAAVLDALRAHGGRAQIVGVTGSPGSGKSTLVDALVAVERAAQRRVAVVAVDPSSPYSGGSILGDRIRMMRWHDDSGVFIRSMASRGHLGGLAAATLQVVALLDAAGFDTVLIETVGVGQSEVDVAGAADTTVLVLTPGTGDGVQAFKAGIMEIADVIAINKADLPGVQRLHQEVRSALDLVHPREGDWRVRIVQTVATSGEGAAELWGKIAAHRGWLEGTGRLAERRRARVRSEVVALVEASVRRRVAEIDDAAIDAVIKGETTPRELMAALR